MTGEHPGNGDLAAYALGALDGHEGDAVRRHLEACPICQGELSEYEESVAALALAAPHRPAPRSLRRRVLREVDADLRARRAVGAASGRRRRSLVPVFGAAALAVGAAVAVLLVLAGGSPAPREIQAQVVGHGTAAVRLTGDRGELIIHGLAAPGTGEIYEVWLQRRTGRPEPNALFDVTAAGNGDVAIPGSLRGVKRVMVTREPAGGTVTPTHPPVILAALG